MRTLLILLLLTSTLTAQDIQPQKVDPVDSIRKKITKAETAFTNDLAKINLEVIKWLDTREKEARKKGDAKTVSLIKDQRTELELTGTIPKPIPSNISRKVDTARDMLDVGYASAQKDALMANLDDMANELEEKRDNLKSEKDKANVFKLVSSITKNLVTNGSFETPLVSNKAMPIAPQTGWTGGGHMIGNWTKEPYPNGIQCVQISGGASVGQTIKDLEVGQKYVLTFYYSTYSTPTGSQFWGTGTLNTKIADVTNKNVIKTKDSSAKYHNQGESYPWIPVTVTFEAKDTEHDLEFVSEGKPFMIIDNVRITQLVN